MYDFLFYHILIFYTLLQLYFVKLNSRSALLFSILVQYLLRNHFRMKKQMKKDSIGNVT